MKGKIVFETTEDGLSVDTNISQVSRTDKMMLIAALANSLQLNECDRLVSACILVSSDLTAQVKKNAVMIPGDMAEWIAKKTGGGGES